MLARQEKTLINTVSTAAVAARALADKKAVLADKALQDSNIKTEQIIAQAIKDGVIKQEQADAMVIGEEAQTKVIQANRKAAQENAKKRVEDKKIDDFTKMMLSAGESLVSKQVPVQGALPALEQKAAGFTPIKQFQDERKKTVEEQKTKITSEQKINQKINPDKPFEKTQTVDVMPKPQQKQQLTEKENPSITGQPKTIKIIRAGYKPPSPPPSIVNKKISEEKNLKGLK